MRHSKFLSTSGKKQNPDKIQNSSIPEIVKAAKQVQAALTGNYKVSASSFEILCCCDTQARLVFCDLGDSGAEKDNPA